MCYLQREITWVQRLAYRVSGICFKTLAGKVQVWNPKTVLKRSHFILLKEHGEPHMKSSHHKNIHFLRLKNSSAHTSDSSFTFVSLYFSKSDFPKRYTVLESFMIYKWNFKLSNNANPFTSQGSADCDSYPVSVLISSFIRFLKQCIFTDLELVMHLHCFHIMYSVIYRTDMLSVLYFLHIWFIVAAFYISQHIQ